MFGRSVNSLACHDGDNVALSDSRTVLQESKKEIYRKETSIRFLSDSKKGTKYKWKSMQAI